MRILSRDIPPRSCWALEQAGIHPLLARLYAARGVHDTAELDDSLAQLLPSAPLAGSEQAARLLADAIAANEHICVVADYDCDGATACAVALRGLRLLGARNTSYLVPNRITDGYGLTPAIAERVHATGAQLLLTVDNGIASLEGVARAQALGMQVVVTDHHLPGSTLPQADALVNPNQPGCLFPSKNMAGVGVMFYVLLALRAELRTRGAFNGQEQPRLSSLLPLVALGTVADVVRLDANNRRLVAQGLKRIRNGQMPAGMAALFTMAQRQAATASTFDLGFALGPRINAGGRVGKSDLGVRLLATEDAGEAAAIAAELDTLNEARRAVEAAVADEAEAAARLTVNASVVVVAGAGWHAGVIGIVAGRLKERLGKPVVVVGIDEAGIGKGSGRSIAGVDLGGAVIAARETGLLEAGGGHAMAAGLTVRADQVAALAAFLDQRLAADVVRARAGAALLLDCALAPAGLSVDLAEMLEGAGPYGAGWPAPKVAAGPLTVVKCDIVGNGHVRAILAGRDGARVKAVAFRHADTELGGALMRANGRPLFVAGRVKRDDWGSRPSAELHLEDAAWAD